MQGALDWLMGMLAEWEIQDNEIQIQHLIGMGTTSRVFAATWCGCLVAAKEIQLTGLEAQEHSAVAFLRELQVWPHMDHPHVLRFVGMCVDGLSLRLFAEYCQGGTVFDLLHNCWQTPLGWRQRSKILVDTASAMEYLHNFEPPIIHRDLKSLNLLLLEPVQGKDDEPNIKLADFGLARIKSQNQQDWASLTVGAGTSHWMAPEVSRGTTYGEKADVFSFGVVIYEVMCRHMAFEDLAPAEARDLISNGQRPSLQSEVVPGNTPSELFDILTQCWHQDPDVRPTFSEAHARLLAVPWPDD